MKIQNFRAVFGDFVAQALRCSPPTSGVPSSRFGHSMWASWWTKRNPVGFSRDFSCFPCPQISFHYFSTLIHFVQFYLIRPVMVAGILAIHRPPIKGLHRISSLDPARCRTWVDNFMLFFKHISSRYSSIQFCRGRNQQC